MEDDIRYYRVTGTIFNFDTNKPKKIKFLKGETLENAEKLFKRLYSGTLWAITARGWKVIQRKKKK